MDAAGALESGADAIGLNFYQKSPRCVTPDQAKQILGAIPHNNSRVGVFVNNDMQQLRELIHCLDLTHVQLHGDESPEDIGRLAPWPVIRAIRVENPDEQSINNEIRQWIDAGASAILLDSAKSGQYGGTGTQLPWKFVSRLRCSVPLILAGGLDDVNVSQAIDEAAPDAVDVASGVEGFPGQKDPIRVRKFIIAARNALKKRVRKRDDIG